MKKLLIGLVASVLGGVLLTAQVPAYCNNTSVVNITAAIGITQIIAAPPDANQIIRICGFNLNAGDGLRSITGTDQAANVEMLETVPANARWKLRSITFTLVTDANVANREVEILIDDGSLVFARISASYTQLAGTTKIYTYTDVGARYEALQFLRSIIPLPPIILAPGWRFSTNTNVRQVGDNYSAPQYLVEEHTVFKFVQGTGSNCATATADLSGVFAVKPSENFINSASAGPEMIAVAGNAICVNNLRPTTLTGTISWASR